MALLTVMLAVLFILAWSILGNVFWHYKKSRAGGNLGERVSGGGKLSVWKALPPALFTAWLIVHFLVNP